MARATGLAHVAGATGRTSEAAVKALYGLPEIALLDMGDFVGGMLKYLRTHPVPRVTIAGGVAKITKLAQGMLDLHSKRGRVELGALAEVARACGGSEALARSIVGANTTPEAFALAASEGIQLGDAVAARAWDVAAEVLAGAPTSSSKSWYSTARGSSRDGVPAKLFTRRLPSGSGADSWRRRARCRGSLPQRATRPTRISAVRSVGSLATSPSSVPSVASMMRSSGQLARTTTAAGQSAP